MWKGHGYGTLLGLPAPREYPRRPELYRGRSHPGPGNPMNCFEMWWPRSGFRAIDGLPQPMIGRVLQVGKYLITVEMRNGQAFRIYKHALAAMRPVSHEARDVQESQLRACGAVQ